MKKPVLGMSVLYRLSDDEKNRIDGNKQDVLPATVVAVWGETEESCVNLKVHSDGHNDLWVTSRSQGEQKGQWL